MPGVQAEPLQAAGVVSRAPMSSTSGPLTMPQPRIPLSDTVKSYLVSTAELARPSPSVSATGVAEEQDAHRRTGRRRGRGGGRRWPAGRRRRWSRWWWSRWSAVARSATADAVVVAATTATSTAPTPAGTATQAFHWRRNVPRRIGCSTRWYETMDTAKVTSTRTTKSP